jgi:hypothetical protein
MSNAEKEHTIRISVAGASGAIGARLVPALGTEPIALDLVAGSS